MSFAGGQDQTSLVGAIINGDSGIAFTIDTVSSGFESFTNITSITNSFTTYTDINGLTYSLMQIGSASSYINSDNITLGSFNNDEGYGLHSGYLDGINGTVSGIIYQNKSYYKGVLLTGHFNDLYATGMVSSDEQTNKSSQLFVFTSSVYIGSGSNEYFLLDTDNGNLTLPQYANTRVDSVTPSNYLATDKDGNVLSISGGLTGTYSVGTNVLTLVNGIITNIS